jgi:hypothetical protein
MDASLTISVKRKRKNKRSQMGQTNKKKTSSAST